MSELAFIDWLRARTPAAASVLLGPGDDAAIVAPTGGPLVVTTDMLLEGSCFVLAEAGAAAVGRKAMNVNLSDCAAMAARPLYALVAVGLPRSADRRLAEGLFAGLQAAAHAEGCAIIGGDTNTWAGPLTIAVTLIGQATGRGPVRRSGAQVGDHLLVTGPVGGSIQGHHLTFTPRVQVALALHAQADLHALIDISDGLAADVWHLCTESGVGAELVAERIPLTPAALASTDGRSPLEHGLRDGEDFELILAVSPTDAERLVRTQPLAGLTLTDIGTIVPTGLWLLTTAGRQPLAPHGYEHRFGTDSQRGAG
jgi:thiamine-monophosphate kinase